MAISLRALFVVAAVSLASSAVRAEEIKAYGLTIVPWSAKVDDDRYRSPRYFKDTIKFYDKLFLGWKNIKKHHEVNLPGVKYVHYENTNDDSKWAGFNVYQAGPQGEVRIFVLKRLGGDDDEGKDKAAKKPKKKSKKTG